MNRSVNDQTPASYRDLIRENPDFRWLWSGQIVSLLGDWFTAVHATHSDETGCGFADHRPRPGARSAGEFPLHSARWGGGVGRGVG